MYDDTKYWIFMEPGRYKDTWRGIGYLYSKTGNNLKGGPNSLSYDRKVHPHSTAAAAYELAVPKEAKDLIRTIFKVDALVVDKSW
jgi:hypothetical protein